MQSLAQRDCTPVLQGLYDISVRKFDSEFWDRYTKEIDQKQFNSLESFKEHHSSLGVSIPLKKLPIDFGFSGGGRVFADNRSYSSFSEFLNSNTYLKQQYQEEFRTVNQAIAEAWAECEAGRAFFSWITVNGDILSFHMQRGVYRHPPELLLTELQYDRRNLEINKKILVWYEKYLLFRDPEDYTGMTIGGETPSTIVFTIKDTQRPAHVTARFNDVNYNSNEQYRVVIPDTTPPPPPPPSPSPPAVPEKLVINLNGQPWMTRACWNKGREWEDFVCGATAEPGMQLVHISTSEKEYIKWDKKRAFCAVPDGHCDGYNEHCENYRFKEACFVNTEWFNWYKQYCADNNLPFSLYAVCQN